MLGFSFLLFLFDLYQSWLEKIYILGALNLLQKGGPFANELLNFVSVYKKPSWPLLQPVNGPTNQPPKLTLKLTSK